MREDKKYRGTFFRGAWNEKQYWFKNKANVWELQLPGLRPGFFEDTWYSNDIEEVEKAKPIDIVNKPPHYHIKVPITGTIVDNQAEIDCWSVINALGMHKHHYAATALAYLWRFQHKGNPIQDLEKAEANIKQEIELLKKESKC